MAVYLAHGKIPMSSIQMPWQGIILSVMIMMSNCVVLCFVDSCFVELPIDYYYVLKCITMMSSVTSYP